MFCSRTWPDRVAAAGQARSEHRRSSAKSDGILLSTLIVAPTSTSAQAAIFRPEIEMDGTRSRVLVDQMREVDAARLGEFAGRLGATEAGEVDQAVRLMLGVL